MVHIHVQWGQETFEMDSPDGTAIEVVKAQLFSLTDIAPDSIMIEGLDADVDDDTEMPWKDGDTIIVREMAPTLDPHRISATCSRLFFPDAIEQPCLLAHRHRKTICWACANICRAEPEECYYGGQKSFVCGCAGVDGCQFASKKESQVPKSPEREQILSILRGERERQQQFAVSQQHISFPAGGLRAIPPAERQAALAFSERLKSQHHTSLLYEDHDFKAKVLRVVPVETLKERAGRDALGMKTPQDALLRHLLAWFKNEFFTWVNQPPCDHCGKATQGIGHAAPGFDEQLWMAGRVEVYKCTSCGKQTRFPRFNHPLKLLDTRRGRCGEWANCFTAICRALGYHARLALDWTDHVWTECWEEGGQCFVHLDPCENAYNAPLLYEEGWGKKLSYVIAVASDEVIDVSRRYTRHWPAMLSRRTELSEYTLALLLDSLNTQVLHSPRLPVATVQHRQQQDLFLLRPTVYIPTASPPTRGAGSQQATVQPQELLPRQSGALEWRMVRGEMGTQPAKTEPRKDP